MNATSMTNEPIRVMAHTRFCGKRARTTGSETSKLGLGLGFSAEKYSAAAVEL